MLLGHREQLFVKLVRHARNDQPGVWSLGEEQGESETSSERGLCYSTEITTVKRLIGVTKGLLNPVTQVPSETVKQIQTGVSESA